MFSQVIAFTCCFITVIVMVAATSTADWIIGEGWREGLFAKCVSENAHLPLPFGIPEEVGCSKARSVGQYHLSLCLSLSGESQSIEYFCDVD